MKDKFYGDKKIADILDGPTPELKKVVFADGKTKVVHVEVLASVVSDQPIDATTERHQRNLPIVKAILETMFKYNAVFDEGNYIYDRVILSLNETRKQASAILWGMESSESTLVDIQNVFDQAHKNKPSDGAVLSPPEFVPEAK